MSKWNKNWMKSADIFKEIEFESKLIVAHLMYIFTIGTTEKKTASFEQKDSCIMEENWNVSVNGCPFTKYFHSKFKIN